MVMINLTKLLFLTTLIAEIYSYQGPTMSDLPPDVKAELIAILEGCLKFTGQCSTPQEANIRFLLYTQNNLKDPITLNTSNPTQIDPSKKVIMVIHGWNSGPDIIGFPELREAYLKRYDCNLIMLDWSYIASQLYTTSYCELPSIAQLVADFLCLLSQNFNIELCTVHLVGHSLGAQMSGFIGQYTMVKCGKRIGRITGLDPAGPLYQGIPESERLDESDAIFVDVIHTDELVFGYWGNCGHVDFHVNCGMFQLGCPQINAEDIEQMLISIISCSHHRSIYLMIESVNSDNFKAESCIICPLICIADIVEPSYITMGEDCPTNFPVNNYWIPTNDVSPYAVGWSPYALGCS